jgi:hypothetical protein
VALTAPSSFFQEPEARSFYAVSALPKALSLSNARVPHYVKIRCTHIAVKGMLNGCRLTAPEWKPMSALTLRRGVIENGTFVSPADFNLSIEHGHPRFRYVIPKRTTRKKQLFYE